MVVTDWNDFHWFTQTYLPKQTIPILRNFADILQAQTGRYIPWKTGERKQAGLDKVIAEFTQMKTSNQLALYIATRQQCEARGQAVSMYRYQPVPQPAPTFGGAAPAYVRPVPQAGPSGWNRSEATSAAYTRPGPALVDWKASPMWKPILAISNMEMLPDFSASESSNTRKERKINFSLTPDVCEKMQQSKSNPSAVPAYSIRLFCSSSDYFRPGNERITPLNVSITNRSIPIEYPSVPDVRVDDLSIPFKERGLRGKAGSAPPFDLNKSSRGLTLVPARLASVAFGHTGATSAKKKDVIKKFYFQVVLVEWTSKEALQKKLVDMAPTPIDQCLDIVRKTRDTDDDIVVGSSRMSLKDPLSYMRITRPVRSTKCSHQQCFDATWWVESNAMHPQWLCPFCNKELHFADLIVDGFFLSILQAVPESVEEVVLEPDGEWHTEDDKFGSPTWLAAHAVPDLKPPVNGHLRSLSPIPRPSSGADLKGKRKAIEILSSDEEDAPSRPSNAPSLRTSAQSRQPSLASSSRPINDGVIDLTLSDSEDDAPAPIPHRNLSNGSKNIWERNGGGAGGFGGAAAALDAAQDGPAMGSYRDGDALFDEEWDDGVGLSRYHTANGREPIRRTRYPLSPSPDPDDPISRPRIPPIPAKIRPAPPLAPSGPATKQAGASAGHNIAIPPTHSYRPSPVPATSSLPVAPRPLAIPLPPKPFTGLPAAPAVVPPLARRIDWTNAPVAGQMRGAGLMDNTLDRI